MGLRIDPKQALSGVLLPACCLLGVGCRPPPAPEEPSAPPLFRDVTEECGLRFVHDAGPTGDYFMPQIMGSGAALFDFDNDGRLDILLLNNGGPEGRPNRLYK